MEQNFKPITRQLATAVIILASITVLSFGIRQVRLSAYWAGTIKPPLATHPSDTAGQSRPKQHFNTGTEPNHSPADSYIVNDKPNPQDIQESFWDEQVSSDDYSEENDDSSRYDNAITKTKSFKDDYAKARGSKDLNKISLSNHEELYFSEEGEYWYVNKQPDGNTVKMQVEILNTGELIAVNGAYYADKEPHRISISDYENIYLTEEGEVWYVSEQPDGDTLKMQVQID